MSDKKSSNPKDVLARGEERCLLHLVPSPGLIETAQAMADGARKYGPYNWREEGVGATTYISAAMRHLRSWLDGEEDADDSKVHHLGHAAACLMILLDAQAVGNLVDDRPLPAPTAQLLNRIKRGAVQVDAIDAVQATYPFGEPKTVGNLGRPGKIFWTGEPQDPENFDVKGGGVYAEEIHVDETDPVERQVVDAHPDPFMAELGFGAASAEPGPTFEEQGRCEKGYWPSEGFFDAVRNLPGKSLSEHLDERREEIKRELEAAGVAEPEHYVAEIAELGYKQHNYGPITLRRNQEESHWRYDPGCDCRKCEEHEYRTRKEADSLDSEPTPNPNGGCC